MKFLVNTIWTIAITVCAVLLIRAFWPSIKMLPEIRRTEWKHAHATLESHEPGASEGYLPTISYSYTVDGKTYHGDRIFAHSVISNEKRWEVIKRLASLSEAKSKRLDCRYDVNDPKRAVLYHRFDFEYAMQAIAFNASMGVLALGMAFLIIVFLPNDKEIDPLMKQYPKAPWMWNPDWSDGVLRSSSGGCAYVFAPLGFLLVLLTGVPAVTCAITAKKLFPDVFALLLPGFGLLIMLLSAVSMLRQFKYGNVTFNMDYVPGIKGGQLQGVLVIPRRLEAEEVQFVLRCQETRVGGGGQSRTHTSTIWTGDCFAPPRYTGRCTEVPVCINIPYDVEETSTHSKFPSYSWSLIVRADTPGFDLKEEFQVPVFETSESDPDFNPDSCAGHYVEQGEEQEISAIISSAASQKIHIDARAHELDIFIGGFKFKPVCISMPLLTIFFVWAPPIAVVLFCYWMNVWFGSHRLQVKDGFLLYSHRVFGIGTTRRFPLSHVQDVVTEMHSESAYRLNIILDARKPLKVLPYIVGKKDATAIGRLVLDYCDAGRL